LAIHFVLEAPARAGAACAAEIYIVLVEFVGGSV